MGMKSQIQEIGQAAPVWVDERRVAGVTGIALQTLRNWRFQGTGPPYFKIGRSVRYRLNDILAFMEERRIDPLK